jgi:hypothetical protein
MNLAAVVKVGCDLSDECGREKVGDLPLPAAPRAGRHLIHRVQHFVLAGARW